MGQMGSCTCENVFPGESQANEAIIEAKPEKKKHEITKIRNRINSVINPLKLPKFEELVAVVATPRIASNRQARKGETLTLVSEDPQHSLTLNVLPGSVGTVSFEIGTEDDIAPAYKLEAAEQKDEFRLSVRYFEAINSEGQEEGAFFLKDEATGLGCFARLRLNQRVAITNGMLISIGNEFIVPCFVDDIQNSNRQKQHDKKLEIKFYGGYAKGEVLQLQCADEEDSVVNVGRARHCRLTLNDPILSKIQCRFVRKNCKWYILDGSESDASTNGTWLYMAVPTRVVPQLQIRCGSQYYRCELEKNRVQ